MSPTVEQANERYGQRVKKAMHKEEGKQRKKEKDILTNGQTERKIQFRFQCQ